MIVITMSEFLLILSGLVLGVGYIQNNNLFPEPLTSAEEKEYLELLKNGDNNAKNILIERNLRLVAHIAKKYISTGVELDDLISIGCIGLIKGINSFNSEKSIKLATYVAKCIENEILMYLRSNKKRNGDVYLNEPIGKDKDDNEITLQEILENDMRNIEDEVDVKIKIKNMYTKMKSVLKKREREIIELRFGLNGCDCMTQQEVAQKFKISRSYVSRIESKAINKLSQVIRD